MQMGGAPVSIPLISLGKHWLYEIVNDLFVKSALLKEEPCYKFMLEYDTQNYFRQLTKTLNLCFLSIVFSEIQHTEMVMRNCIFSWFDINS